MKNNFLAYVLYATFFIVGCKHSTEPDTSPPTDGLVAHYPFNGNADDASGNGNHGEVISAVLIQDRNGNTNSAFAFDGVNDYILFLPELGISDSTQFSISIWINLRSYPEGMSPQQGIARREFAIMDFSFGNGDDLQHLFIGIRNSNDPLGHNNEIIFYERDINENIVKLFGSTPDLNTWYHVVATRDKLKFQLYLNGQLLDEAIDENLTKFTSSTVNVGRAYDNQRFQHNFDGMIDDIRLYNRALEADEVTILLQELN